MFDSLWPHGLQPTRPPCPSPTPRVCSNSCPSSWWCHPTISSSVPLSSPSPAFYLSQHQNLFQGVRSSHQVAKLVEFQLQHHPSNEYSGLNPHQPPTAIFMSALWDTVPPHEVCRAGCCPSRRPGEGSSCALTGAGSTWLEGGLVPKARLRPGTPLQTPRWIPNCWSVFDFPHEIRLNIWVHKYLGLQTVVREGLAGCRLRLHTGQIYAAPWKLPKPTRRCNEEFPATHTPHRQVSTTNFLLLEELSNKAFFSPIKW